MLDMKRREFIALLGARPRDRYAAGAQQTAERIRRIGVRTAKPRRTLSGRAWSNWVGSRGGIFESTTALLLAIRHSTRLMRTN
jgi:hypothetical protein